MAVFEVLVSILSLFASAKLAYEFLQMIFFMHIRFQVRKCVKAIYQKFSFRNEWITFDEFTEEFGNNWFVFKALEILRKNNKVALAYPIPFASAIDNAKDDSFLLAEFKIRIDPQDLRIYLDEKIRQPSWIDIETFRMDFKIIH